jgi:predicted flap endonuclease-1-like 5' DNA nuclease
MVSFRDARILSLEERLEAAELKLAEQERLLLSVEHAEPGAVARGSAVVAAPRSRVSSATNGLVHQGAPADSGGPLHSNGIRHEDGHGSEESDDAESAEEDEDLDGAPDTLAAAPERFPGEMGVPGEMGKDIGEDLRVIAGIGPRFEAALRKQGITRLSQIASWSEADVRQVAKALKIPKSRIVKGRWVESAREAIGTRPASE